MYFNLTIQPKRFFFPSNGYRKNLFKQNLDRFTKVLRYKQFSRYIPF